MARTRTRDFRRLNGQQRKMARNSSVLVSKLAKTHSATAAIRAFKNLIGNPALVIEGFSNHLNGNTLFKRL